MQLVADPAWDAPQFVIKRGDAIDFDPGAGTVNRGVGLSRLFTIEELHNALGMPSAGDGWSAESCQQAERDFEKLFSAMANRGAQIEHFQRQALRSALVEEAAQILIRAAMVEVVQAYSPDNVGEHPLVVDERAVRGLSRRGFPFSALLQLAGKWLPSHEIPVASEIVGASPAQRKKTLADLGQAGRKLLTRWNRLGAQAVVPATTSASICSSLLAFDTIEQE